MGLAGVQGARTPQKPLSGLPRGLARGAKLSPSLLASNLMPSRGDAPGQGRGMTPEGNGDGLAVDRRARTAQGCSPGVSPGSAPARPERVRDDSADCHEVRAYMSVPDMRGRVPPCTHSRSGWRLTKAGEDRSKQCPEATARGAGASLGACQGCPLDPTRPPRSLRSWGRTGEGRSASAGRPAPAGFGVQGRPLPHTSRSDVSVRHSGVF